MRKYAKMHPGGRFPRENRNPPTLRVSVLGSLEVYLPPYPPPPPWTPLAPIRKNIFCCLGFRPETIYCFFLVAATPLPRIAREVAISPKGTPKGGPRGPSPQEGPFELCSCLRCPRAEPRAEMVSRVGAMRAELTITIYIYIYFFIVQNNIYIYL